MTATENPCRRVTYPVFDQYGVGVSSTLHSCLYFPDTVIKDFKTYDDYFNANK